MFHKSASNFLKLSQEQIKEFLGSFDTILTDCDGVLWVHDDGLENSAAVLNELRSLGKRIFYVTNNSTKTREEYVTKCRNLNFICDKNEVISTAYLAANYLKELGFKKKVYVVGESGVATELDTLGIKHFGVGPDVLLQNRAKTVANIQLDPEVGAVVVGYDEHISLPKMIKAASYLKDPNCLFIATNTDQRFPYGTSLIIPGAGCIISSIKMASQREPIIMGKPNAYISEFLMSEHAIDPKRTIMIGDNSSTDILLGTRCGFQTLLVLSGITTLSEVAEWQKSNNNEHRGLIPDLYLEKLGDLLPYLVK